MIIEKAYRALLADKPGFNRDAVASYSPGLAGRRPTLGRLKIGPTLKELYHSRLRRGGASTLSELEMLWTVPRVARSSQPWAERFDPFRIV